MSFCFQTPPSGQGIKGTANTVMVTRGHQFTKKLSRGLGLSSPECICVHFLWTTPSSAQVVGFPLTPLAIYSSVVARLLFATPIKAFL